MKKIISPYTKTNFIEVNMLDSKKEITWPLFCITPKNGMSDKYRFTSEQSRAAVDVFYNYINENMEKE